MNPRRKKRLTIVASILIGISVVAGFVLYALSQNIDLFYTPSEITQGKKDTGIKPSIGDRIRIGGLVVPNSVKRDPNNLKVTFKLSDMKMPITFDDSDPMISVYYEGILPEHLHWPKEKKSGATSHVERWNNILRQQLVCFVRKTLSFSKSDMMHRIMLGWFIIEYNLQVPSLYYLTTIQQSLFYELL